MHVTRLMLGPIVLAVTTGCSVVLVRGPGDARDPKTGEIQCTSSVAAPVVDTGIGSVLLLGTALGGAYVEVNGKKSDATVPALLGGAVFAGSAIYGYVVTANCRKARGGKGREAPPEEPAGGGGNEAAPKPEVAVPPDPTSRPEPPSTAAGFKFGATVQQAAETCTSTGGEWQEAAPEATCSKTPVYSGFEGQSRLVFTDGKVSSVRIVREAPDAEANALKDRYVAAAVELRKKYGRPDRVSLTVPPTCSDRLASCLRVKQASVSAVWTWPNQFTISLNLEATASSVMLALEYRAPHRPESPPGGSQ